MAIFGGKTKVLGRARRGRVSGFTPSKYLHPSAHGGELRRQRSGRRSRPISTHFSMHLVLRSTLAKGIWSFVRGGNRTIILNLMAKHAVASGVQILSSANASNHLHLHVKVASRRQYKHFVRALAGDIALQMRKIIAIDGTQLPAKNFWDRRPFTTIVATAKYVAKITDYIKINQLEGSGVPRAFARIVVDKWRRGVWHEREEDNPELLKRHGRELLAI